MKTLFLIIIFSLFVSSGTCQSIENSPLYNRIEDVPIKNIICGNNREFKIKRKDVNDTLLVLVTYPYMESQNKMGALDIVILIRKNNKFNKYKSCFANDFKKLDKECQNEILFINKLLNGIDLVGMGKRKELPFCGDFYAVGFLYITIPISSTPPKSFPKKRK